jgi:hypothetical protein
MLDRKLHKFYLSYKLNGKIDTLWIDGINLRHAKDKLLMKYPESTDIMDWTYENPEDLEKYKAKHIEPQIPNIVPEYKEYPEDFSKFF